MRPLHWHRLWRMADNPYHAQVPIFDSATSCVACCYWYTPDMLMRECHTLRLSHGSSARPFIGQIDQIGLQNVKISNRDDWHSWKHNIRTVVVIKGDCLDLRLHPVLFQPSFIWSAFHAICMCFLQLRCAVPTLRTSIYNVVGQLFRFDSMHVVQLCKQKDRKGLEINS